MKKFIHSFGKYIVDLILVVFWIWVPMYLYDLKSHANALLIWVFVLGTLVALLYLLHTKGWHKLK